MPIRPRAPLTLLASTLLLAAALAGCALPRDNRPLARCLEALDPTSLGAQDLPRPTGMIGAASASTRHGEISDAEHEMHVEVEDPAATLTALCHRLEAELADRCDVRRQSTGPAHCAFSVASSYRSTTGEDGIHHHRRMTGRVHLAAEPADGGRTRLLLTATEWPA
jgi:hypothetical protein